MYFEDRVLRKDAYRTKFIGRSPGWRTPDLTLALAEGASLLEQLRTRLNEAGFTFGKYRLGVEAVSRYLDGVVTPAQLSIGKPSEIAKNVSDRYISYLMNVRLALGLLDESKPEDVEWMKRMLAVGDALDSAFKTAGELEEDPASAPLFYGAMSSVRQIPILVYRGTPTEPAKIPAPVSQPAPTPAPAPVTVPAPAPAPIPEVEQKIVEQAVSPTTPAQTAEPVVAKAGFSWWWLLLLGLLFMKKDKRGRK